MIPVFLKELYVRSCNVSIEKTLSSPEIVARYMKYLDSKEGAILVCLNKKWATELSKPEVWEILAGAPHRPLLSNIFRRASSYCYRELDAPSPNVNRRGTPPVIRACLLSERTLMWEYLNDLKMMSFESSWLRGKPVTLNIPNIHEMTAQRQSDPPIFEKIQILNYENDRGLCNTRILTGGIQQDSAKFYLWDLDSKRLSASISQSNASCYHACNEALAIGSTDGTVKLWDLNTIRDHRVLNADLDPMINMAPTKTVSHRAPLGMMPFIRTRLKERIINVHVDNSKGSHFHLATATEKGEAFVWDVHKAEPILSLSSNKIHKSALSRASKEKTPHVTSLMLFRTTLVCGTSCGFIRVFDLRSGKLTHRLAGHPGAVLKTDTKERVLWSSGREGTVRWWGGKTAKVLTKSALCEGTISALEMDENVVVAGYSIQGMESWDVRTQQSLCSFSSAHFGGVKSLQFDNRKILAVSNNGQAALWRWHSSHPFHFFKQPLPDTSFLSAQFNDRHLILGTNRGELIDYDRYLN